MAKNKFMDKTTEHRGPDFIGIGVPKSGSTWFMRVLSQHPNIFTTAKKEPHIFIIDDTYRKDLINYYKLYKKAKPHEKAGEFSTIYINFAEKSSHRIKKHFPNVKLICILRDPLERAISHDRWLKQHRSRTSCCWSKTQLCDRRRRTCTMLGPR